MDFIAIASVAALGGLLFGYDTGVISSALLFLREVFHLGAAKQGLVVGIALGAAAAGAAAAGSVADRFGRRPVIILTALLFVAGSAVSGTADDLGMLLVGRLIIGVAIGIASMVTPLYLSEMAPPRRRGAVVSMNQLFLTVGILLSYVAGFWLSGVVGGWRWMLGLGAVPGLLLAAGMAAMPESPRWLAGHGRPVEAEAALRRIRGAAPIEAELAELRRDVAERGRSAPTSALLTRNLRLPLTIGIALAFFQQATGINTVIYYAPTLLQASGLPAASTAILATAGIGLVNVAMTVVSMSLVDRVGRRPLLLVGLGGMALSLGALAALRLLASGEAPPWEVLAALCAYVAFFAIGLGPIFWLLISEIFPLAVRGRAMAVATVAQWVFNLVVTSFFLDLVARIGQGGTFLLFAAVAVAAWVFAFLNVPETRGKTLEEIEAELDARGA